MRSFVLAAVVLGVGALTAGCYESAFPLDRAPQTDLATGVAGAWRCLPADPDETDEAMTLIIKRAKERVYDVTLQENDQEPDHFQAYASLVKGAPVINLKDPDPAADKPWIFLRTAFLRADVLAVQILSDKAVNDADASPAGIRTLLEAPQEKAGLFEDASVCVRQKH